jgi:hypothetical protein
MLRALGVVRARLRKICRGARRFDFYQPQSRSGGNKTGVHMLACRIEYFGVFRPVDAYGGGIRYQRQFALFKTDGAVGYYLAVAQVCRCAHDENGVFLGRGGDG